MPRKIMKRTVVLSLVLFGLIASSATANTWRVVHLHATPKPQWFKAPAPERSAMAREIRLYRNGHRLHEGLTPGGCTLVAAGQGITAISLCTRRTNVEFWGKGSFTLVFHFR